jgi:hypothetical protein
MRDSYERGGRSLEAELEALRHELSEMRAEQREMAATIEGLYRTFRALATQLGIAAEPYRRSSDAGRERPDLPGFA